MVKIKRIISVLIVFIFVFAVASCGTDGIDVLPEYYHEHILQKISRIKEIDRENKIAASFCFVTDLHWETNTKNTPALIKYLSKKSHIKDMVILGGDYILYDYPTKEEAIENINIAINAFKQVSGNVKALAGNHEDNYAYELNTPKLTTAELAAVLRSPSEKVCYFDEDDEKAKIRFLYLDTNTLLKDDEQKAWLYDSLTSLPEGWTALIFMHIYNHYRMAGKPTTIDKNGTFMENFLTENREKIKCDIAGIFSGHIHRDYSAVNSAGVQVICTVCDTVNEYKRWDNSYRRTIGAYTEQAFDVIQIDTTNRKVFLTRVGAGADREYTY